MGKGPFKPIDPVIKQQILERVRLGVEPITHIAREFGIGDSTIHGWLEKKVARSPDHTASELENSPLHGDTEPFEIFVTEAGGITTRLYALFRQVVPVLENLVSVTTSYR